MSKKKEFLKEKKKQKKKKKEFTKLLQTIYGEYYHKIFNKKSR